MVNLVVDILSCYRLTELLVNEDGPFGVFDTLRRKTGIEYMWNADKEEAEVLSYPEWNPLHCTLCTSVWVAFLMYVFPRTVRYMLAISGGAIIIEKLVSKK